MDSSEQTPPQKSAWLQIRRHFTESFSGELLKPERAGDGESGDQWRDGRRRNAYRYILILLVAVILPVVAYNLYVAQIYIAAGTLALLVVMLGNIALLSAGRDPAVSLHVLLFFSLGLVLLSLYRGQEFSLFLIYPLMVALPVLLRMRWAVGLAAVCVVVGAPLVISRFEPMAAFVIGLSLGLTWLVSAWLVFAVSEQAKRLRGMAITDPLTGAYNRRYLELRAAKCLKSWERYDRMESLLIMDIDYFKRINDKFGHAAGDKALKDLVTLISKRVRNVDTLCRFGGEEFVLLLSEADARLAGKVANKLREAVSAADILPEGNMTISIGVSDVGQADDVDHWFKLADAALYLAKKNGRNRVELASSEPLQVVPLAKTVPDWR